RHLHSFPTRRSSDLALQRIVGVVANEMEGERLRLLMIGRLAEYPLEDKHGALTSAAAARPGNSDEVRAEAMAALSRAGAPEVLRSEEHTSELQSPDH